MELPQSRSFGTEGRKPTHDFLSLYNHSTLQEQDQRPPSEGGHLKTHDFLQVGKTNAKEENTVEISSSVEKPPPPVPPPSSSVEHILPGGIGTYSISHISYFGQKVPKPEGTIFTVAQATSTAKSDENSNCSSYTGSGFTLWEESAVKKGKTGSKNVGETPNIGRDATAKARQWTSQSSSNNSNSHRNSFSSLSSFQASGLKSQSLIEMMKAAKSSTIDEDLDDDEEFILKKENSSTTSHKGDLRVKVDGKSNDQKPNTLRSKHSATEQRRRSKINDRFQMLRELIPHSDQKRDKASFLLEVIEYIQFLQEKAQKYEWPCLGWNQETTKMAPCRNNQNPAESYVDQSRRINNESGPATVFAAKLDEKKVPISPTIPGSAQNSVESDISTATTFKTMDNQLGITNKPMSFPMSLQPNCYNPVRNGDVAAQIPPTLASDAENMTSHSQARLCNTRSCTHDRATANGKLKEQDLTAGGGTINISAMYSQGLLNTLTQSLQSSGVDLSQASISVQIDLSKRATGKPISAASTVKNNEVPSTNQGTTRSRIGNCEDSDQAIKKQRTDKR